MATSGPQWVWVCVCVCVCVFGLGCVPVGPSVGRVVLCCVVKLIKYDDRHSPVSGTLVFLLFLSVLLFTDIM